MLPVAIGTDGVMAAFSKIYKDEDLAIQTQFHIAESYFELFKSQRKLKQDAKAEAALTSGQRVLRDLQDDYPNPKYAPRVSYLLGQFAQEMEERSYRRIWIHCEKSPRAQSCPGFTV
ncbi:hypothetical protein N9103_02445 [Akkermansiaceae bacterium]|nr:hypothetical protein [Akkermansiaceae bacterium]